MYVCERDRVCVCRIEEFNIFIFFKDEVGHSRSPSNEDR